MTPKYIYFDLDDTLLDHKKAEAAALKEVHTNFSIFEDIRADDLITAYGTVNKAQWKLYSKGEVTRKQLQRNRFEFTLQELELNAAVHDEVGSYYMNCYRKYWEWVEGAKEVFVAISQKFDVGILTNGFSETQKLKFKQFELHAHARHLVISEEVGELKPHPSVFQHATELAGCSASDILYVGDSFTSDVIGASEFGWRTAWYTQTSCPQKERKADFVFNTFDKLHKYLSN